MQFTEFLTTAEQIAANTVDRIVPERLLRMNASAGLCLGESSEALRVEQIAHEQIGARLGIPRAYYRRMLEQGHEALLAENVNEWLAESEVNRMVRLDKSKPSCRAFVSDKFFRIDNFPLLEAIAPQVGDEIQVERCDITSERMDLCLVTPRLRGDVQKGDTVQGGLRIRNSEVGRGTVEIIPFFKRLVCLNGMTVADNLDVYSRRHVTGRQDVGWLSQETHRRELAAVVSAVRDAVHAGLSQEAFEARIQSFRGAAEQRVDASPLVVENLGRLYALTEGETQGVLTRLLQSTERATAWTVANAITHLAHDTQDYDRQTELQAIGGRVIDLRPAQWHELAVAA